MREVFRMTKLIGMTKQAAAVLMAMLLVIGSASGSIYASETDTGPGMAAEAEAENPGTGLAEEETGDRSDLSADSVGISVESYSEEAAEIPEVLGEAEEEDAKEYFTVTLDANGGYFENERDDVTGGYVEYAEVVDKLIPVGGTVTSFPVFAGTDPDGRIMTFAGWSLDRDGEPLSAGDEEYAPADNCVLYAVWEKDDAAAETEDVSREDTGNQEADYIAESTDQTDSSPEPEETSAAEEPESETADTGTAEWPEEAVGYPGTTEEPEAEAGDTGTDEDPAVRQEGEDSAEAEGPEAAGESGDSGMEVEPEAGHFEEETGEKSSDTLASEEESRIEASEEMEETVREELSGSVAANGTCGENLTWILDDQGTLTISGSGEMDDYASQGSPFFQNDTINKVVIEDGVTSIGSKVFEQCGYLSSITIPESVTSIGSGAFHVCARLSSITIPESVTSIGNEAFIGCVSLNSITIPEGVTSIGDHVFENCFGLSSITIPEGVTSIGDGAFNSCGSLTSITIPEGMTSIGNRAFSECESLTSIIIPEGVTSINERLFYRCTGLTSITIPVGVTSIGSEAFNGCTDLTSITIPESVISIDRSAFSDIPNLTISGIEYTYIYWYAHENNIPFDPIEPTSISSADVTLPDQTYTYTGEALEPKVVVFWGEDRLTKGIDYTVAYSNNTNAGTATVTINGVLRYSGSVEKTFTIEKAEQSISASDMTLTYPNSGKIEVPGKHGELSYTSSDTNVVTVDPDGNVTAAGAGTATVTITAEQTPNYYNVATKTITVTVARGTQSITAFDMTLTYPNSGKIEVSGDHDELSYTSSDTNIVTVDSEGKVKAEGVGTATVTITAEQTPNYNNAATKTITVTVAKAAQSITASNLSLTYPNTGTITVSGNKGALSYKSSNTAIAMVDPAGKVTAKGAGTAKITIYAEETDNYEAVKKEITVTVSKAAQSITASNLSLTFPNSGKITASGNKGSLSYKSSNTAIATVDSAGKVTAKGAGKVTITITAAATSNYNAATKTITVTVAKAAQSITAKAAASSVAVGKTTTVSITGAKGTKSFKSSDTTIATISSAGMVTAKKVGTVKITATSAATSNYNAASKTVTIKVVPAATASLAAENQATGIKLTWKKVTGANGYKVYRESTLIKTITSGSTVTFADAKANTNGTKYTYKVVAKGTTGDSTLSRSRVIYRVARPAVSSVTNTAASKMTLKWGKNAKATGYVIHYSTDKTFKSGNKSVTVTSASAVSRVISGLTKGKTYYVRIRTYKTVGSAKYWSVWSAARSVKISK